MDTFKTNFDNYCNAFFEILSTKFQKIENFLNTEFDIIIDIANYDDKKDKKRDNDIFTEYDFCAIDDDNI